MSSADYNSDAPSTTPPQEFSGVVSDFIKDIRTTFPEYSPIISKWWTSGTEDEVSNVFAHCLRAYPPHFMDIINKNTDLFTGEGDTEFLPGLSFRHIWASDLSDHTRDVIWKYMQLILFSVIGRITNSSDLGDTAQLMESLNSDELHEKLNSVVDDMKHIFSSENDAGASASASTSAAAGDSAMPDPKDIHEHINKMMKGKLGKLALEFAEETAQELNLSDENLSGGDVLNSFMKDPSKLTGMVSKVGKKLDEKIKTGELTESELMAEGMEIMNNMKDMPGMKDMAKMFGKMGFPGMDGKHGKINTKAMESQMGKNMKMAQMKERMKQKAMARAAAANMAAASAAAPSTAANKPMLSEDELVTLFNTPSDIKTTGQSQQSQSSGSKKGKKGKKGKK